MLDLKKPSFIEKNTDTQNGIQYP